MDGLSGPQASDSNLHTEPALPNCRVHAEIHTAPLLASISDTYSKVCTNIYVLIKLPSDLQHRLSLINLLKSTSGCSGELTLNMFKKDPSPRLKASDTLSRICLENAECESVIRNLFPPQQMSEGAVTFPRTAAPSPSLIALWPLASSISIQDCGSFSLFMLPPCRPAAYVIMISFNQLISKAFKPFKKCFYIFIM